jgi:hypothetical protein
MVDSEKVIEYKFNAYIRSLGGWTIKLLTNHVKGLPDRLCLLPDGVLFFAELKTTKQKPKKLQKFIHLKLEMLGFKVYVIDTIEDIFKIK